MKQQPPYIQHELNESNYQHYENFNSFNDKHSNFSEQYSPIHHQQQNELNWPRMPTIRQENSFLNMNPMQTQDDSRMHHQQLQSFGGQQTMMSMHRKPNQTNFSPQSSQKKFENQVYQSMMSNKTPNRGRSSSKKRGGADRSNSASRANIGSKVNNGLIASPYSPESAMTRNPYQLQDFQNQAQGIDDSQSALYKDFDKCGRTQNAFMQRAALAGIKNLHTASYRNSSPLRMVQSRFPEKYAPSANNFNNTGSVVDAMSQDGDGNDRDLTSQQIIQNVFQYAQDQQDKGQDDEVQHNQYQAGFEQSRVLGTQDSLFLIEAGFQAVSETIIGTLGSFEQWQMLNIEDKLLQFASFLSNMRKDLRLGGVVGVYLIFRNNPMSIGEEIKRVIIEELFTTLSEYETQEEIFMMCVLEVVGLIGPNERSLGRIGIIKGLLCEPSLKRLQLSCFSTLIQLGFEGFRSIIDLASKDYNSLQTFLLQNLLQVRTIQRIILVPSILTQLNMTENIKKQECIALLNRMGTLVWESGGLPIIVELLEDGIVDRQLLASVLRTSGDEGEELLIKILRYHKDYKVRMAAASVLSYRLPNNPRQLDVDLRLDSNDVVQLNAIPPGQICRYCGPISSVIQDEQNKNEQEMVFQDQPFVEINSRDFLASLQRMLAMTNEYFVQQFDNDEERNQFPQLREVRLLQKMNYQAMNTAFAHDPVLFNTQTLMYQTNYFNQTQSQQKRNISENIIRLLAQQLLKEEKAQVREVIAASIGTIGLPEGELCVDSLIRSLQTPDEDPNVKAMCVWSIGRLANYQTGQKAKKILVAALKDSYWKVRAAACTAVAQIGEPVAQCTIPILTKLLREGQVNRQTVAETMINVGTLGEQTLVQILKNEPENNHKLRECIVRALALANVNNPNIDFVIEILYQTSKDKNASVRRSSLLSLDILHKKTVNDSVTYLKARHLLPFFYRCLSDKDKQVRNCALLCIQNFGPQGELMFIEGLTKEKNFQIRCECANGLAQIGPSTFRTLLLSLHDPNPAVRDTSSQAILKCMTPESIDEAFQDKDHQRQTIKCAIREVLQNNLVLMNEIKTFLQRVLIIFEGGMTFIPDANYSQVYQSANKENQYGSQTKQPQQWITDKTNNYHQVRNTTVPQNKASFTTQSTMNATQNNMILFNNHRASFSKSRQDSRSLQQNNTDSGYRPGSYSRYL